MSEVKSQGKYRQQVTGARAFDFVSVSFIAILLANFCRFMTDFLGANSGEELRRGRRRHHPLQVQRHSKGEISICYIRCVRTNALSHTLITLTPLVLAWPQCT